MVPIALSKPVFSPIMRTFLSPTSMRDITACRGDLGSACRRIADPLDRRFGQIPLLLDSLDVVFEVRVKFRHAIFDREAKLG